MREQCRGEFTFAKSILGSPAGQAFRIVALAHLNPRRPTHCVRRRTPGAWPAWRLWVFALGVFSVWGAIDWPIGTLGSGYLLSVHEVQYLLRGSVA